MTENVISVKREGAENTDSIMVNCGLRASFYLWRAKRAARQRERGFCVTSRASQNRELALRLDPLETASPTLHL